MSERVVQVGGDLFQVKLPSYEITEVVRNWMNVMTNGPAGLASARSFQFYSPKLSETVSDDDKRPFSSNVASTSSLRNGNFGALTPATVPGAVTIHVREAWALIVAGLERKGRPPLVLSLLYLTTLRCPPRLRLLSPEMAAGSMMNRNGI